MGKKGRLVQLMIILCAPMISPVLIEGIFGSAVLVGGYLAPKIYCHFAECCHNKWIKPNITGLQSALRRRVFGQHLVTETVLKALVGHLNNKSPNKALAISFNGWTGSGKNFVSKIIAEHIFKKGLESNYVHLIIATHEFPSSVRSRLLQATAAQSSGKFCVKVSQIAVYLRWNGQNADRPHRCA